MGGTRRDGAGPQGRYPSFEALDPEEKASVLMALLRVHPDLRREAEEIAHQLLLDIDAGSIADEVESEVLDLPVDALNGRAGRQRDGYVDPTDAAWELLEEAVKPYVNEASRLAVLGSECSKQPGSTP